VEPTVSDRREAVNEAGASEMMREVNIRKRFAPGGGGLLTSH